jgi:hypothetical protein
VVLALFIFTVAAALLVTQDTKHFTLKGDAAANNTLLDEFSTINEVSSGNQVAVGSAPAPSAATLTRLRQVPGVQGIVEFRADPRLQVQGSPGRAGVVRPARERPGHRPVSGGSCHGGRPRSTRGISATPTSSASRSTARPANDLPVTRRQS